jgi:hypothetical protein
MPIQSYTLNNGTLTLGAAPLDISCQLTNAQINPTENVTTEDAVHVLCGDVLPSSDVVDYSFTLGGTVLQDLSLSGVVDYSWANMGEEVPFVFTPDNDQAATWTGTVRIIPLQVGGDVPTRPTSDFEWVIVGTPVPDFVAVSEDVG